MTQTRDNIVTKIPDGSYRFSYSAIYDPIYRDMERRQYGNLQKNLTHNDPAFETAHRIVTDSALGDFQSNKPIRLTCSFKKGSRNKYGYIDRDALTLPAAGKPLSLASFVALLNITTYAGTAVPETSQRENPAEFLSYFLSQMEFRATMKTIEGANGVQMKLVTKNLLSRYAPVGTTCFVYGRVLKFDLSGSSSVKITCRTLRGDYTLYLGRNYWEELKGELMGTYRSHSPLWISGFVSITECTAFKRSSSGFGPSLYSPGQKFKKYNLKTAVMFTTNQYGLLSFSDHEIAFSDEAMKSGSGLLRLLPDCQDAHSSSPLLALSSDGNLSYLSDDERDSFTDQKEQGIMAV